MLTVSAPILLPASPLTHLPGGLLAIFPKLHALYVNLDRQIVDVDNPMLQRSFKHCCYPACHFNLHRGATLYHADWANWICSMCAVFSGGKYDPVRSAHFLAWSLGLAIEFPPGCALYIPSAAIPHSNTALADGEIRHSMAFFLPAGNVRWYHNGFRSDKSFREQADPEQLQAWVDYRKDIWKIGLELLRYDT
jgi:hypothetical protein